MDSNLKVLMVTGVLGAAFLAPTLGRSIPELISFNAGSPVSAADFNSNFDTLRTAIENLEGQVATLESELATARSKAGSIEVPGGNTVPVLRKVITGTKSATVTTQPHGIAGNPATARRILGCQVIADALAEQSVNYATTVGSNASLWCEVRDTEVEIAWATATTITYQIVIEYAETAFR
jgi:hypothetical protein